MSDKELEIEQSGWLSTYGLITAKRLLERYKIKIADKELFEALKKPNSFYQRILKVPMNNIFSGIILQQTKDYQIYVQKMLIDYLLSGESDKREEAVGGSTRGLIEEERQRLVSLDIDFRDLELTHENLIAKSQEVLIKSAEEWIKSINANEDEAKSAFAAYAVIKPKSILRAAMAELISVYNFQDDITLKDPIWKRIELLMEMELTPTLKEVFSNQLKSLTEVLHAHEEKWAQYLKQSYEIQSSAKGFRTNYYDFILKVTELIQNLSEYKSNPMQTEENKESLFFDSSIGD